MRIKTLILTNIPTHYRINLFKYISWKTELTVLFTDTNEKGKRIWRVNFGENYSYLLLRESILSNLIMIIKEICRNKVIIIGGYGLVWMQIAIILLKIFRRKYILWTDGALIKREMFLRKLIKKQFIFGATAYITTGKKGEEHLIYYGADKNKIVKIPLTFDTAIMRQKYIEFKENIEEFKSSLNLNKKVILTVGTLIPRKGIIELIKVFNRLEIPDLSLLIVGDGELKESILDYVKNNRNIVLNDFVEPELIYKYYAISDIFVLNSFNDPWGLVINEAMTCNLPVISTDKACASYELIKDGVNGFTIESGNDKLLEEKLKYLLENDEIRVKYGDESYAIIKTLDNNIIYRDYINVIEKVLTDEKP